MISRACNHHDVVSNTVEARCKSHRKTYIPVWGTKVPLLALPEDSSSNNHPMNTDVDLAARIHSAVALEEATSRSVSELVIVNYEPVAHIGDGDSDDGCVGIAGLDDVDYYNAETVHDDVVVVQIPAQGVHDSARTNDFDNARGLSVCHTVNEADSDDTGSAAVNTIHASLDMGTEADPRPKKSWVN